MLQLQNQKAILSCFIRNFIAISIEINQTKSTLFLVRRKHYGHKQILDYKNNATNINKVFREKHVEAILPVAFGRNKTISQTSSSKRVSLPPNIIFRYCPSATVDNFDSFDALSSKSYSGTLNATSPRPLLLLLGWLMAKEQHMDKYREFWFQRGYDILSVRTSPFQLLFPYIGGRLNAIKLYEFLANHQPFYDEILIHGFSVGGYQLGEFVNHLVKNLPKDEMAQRIYKSLKGIVLDSCVFAQDAAFGASNAITRHPIYQPMLEKAIQTFLMLTKPVTYDRYISIQNLLFENESRIPGIILHSKTDLVSSISLNKTLFNIWKEKNMISDYHCWKDGPHVLLYKEHRHEYQQKVDDFISKIGITKAKRL